LNNAPAALQLRDKKRLFDYRIEFAQKRAGFTVSTERNGAEAFTGEFPKTLLGNGKAISVGGIKGVPRVALSVHHDLVMHESAPRSTSQAPNAPPTAGVPSQAVERNRRTTAEVFLVTSTSQGE